MKLSNKQQLFDRRLKVYMTVHGLLELYRQNRHIFEMDKKNEVQRTIDLEYKWLTNNIFMAEICEVIDDPLEINYRRKFMKKCEELQGTKLLDKWENDYTRIPVTPLREYAEAK